MRWPYVATEFSAGHRKRKTRLAVASLALGLLSAGIWFAWLGWDHTYYEAGGVSQGPYRAWQVIGCGLSVGAVAVIVFAWVRQSVAIAILAPAAVIGFAVPWSADAGRTDESGLWVVGLFYLLVGGVVVLSAVLALANAVLTRRPRARSR